MSRPKSAEHRSRYTFRLLPEELEKIGILASYAGLTVSACLRRCALRKCIRPRVSVKAMAELRRLGGLQKYCLRQIKDQPGLPEARHQLNAVLGAILVEIKRLQSDETEA